MIKKNIIKKLYTSTLRIREIELEIANRYKLQKMRCPIHLSVGQESIAVGVCHNLKSKDEVVTAHRSHAHYLAKGGNLKKMISELHGKVTGCANGKGGSMHLIDLNANVVAAVPIVGSTIPIGVGRAWANKLNNKDNIVVIFFGDGATEEGVFQESLDFASLHKLRILFVCENNNFSVYSSKLNRQNPKRNVIKMARSLGVKSVKLKNHDLIKVYSCFKNLVSKVRKFPQPYLIEIETFRTLEHCGPNNDDYLNYRYKKDIKKWLQNCQVKTYEDKIIKNKITSLKNLKFIKNSIQKEISKAFKFAELSSYPKKNLLIKDVYSKKI